MVELDVVQILIQIKGKNPAVTNMKGLAKVIYDNLNPRHMRVHYYNRDRGTHHGILDVEIVDFLKMWGLQEDSAWKIFHHLHMQGFYTCTYSFRDNDEYIQDECRKKACGIYDLNIHS